MWETGARPGQALGRRWHLWLLCGLIAPPLTLGVLTSLQVQPNDFWFAVILVIWAVALLLWIPSLTYAAGAKKPKDIALVALYPLLSALVFAILGVVLQEESILGNFERLI